MQRLSPDAQDSPDSASAQGVKFSSLNVFADSVVINAVTTRALGNFVERYLIARTGSILVDPQYSVSLSGDGTLDDNIAQTIGDFVSHVRVALLADPTPVSYCLVNEMWDSSGRLLLKGEAAAKSKYTDRKECPAESEYKDNPPGVRVTIGGARVYPDSIVIYGLSKRGGGSFPEHYLIVRSGNRILAREYSLSFIFTS